MPRQESMVTPPVRGASRTSDFAWPINTLQAVGSVAIGTTFTSRQGVGFSTEGQITGFGVPPAGSGYTTYRGRVCHKQTGSGTSGGFWTSDTLNIQFPTLATSIGGNYIDDFRCWRMLAIYAIDSAGIGSGDVGLEVGPRNNYTMISALGAGIRLGPTAAGAISLQIRTTAGAALAVDTVAANVDVADWNAYEMRFIGATSTTDAAFKAFVNGRQIGGAFTFGAGTVLPTFFNGTTIGYQIGMGNRGATAVYIAQCGLQISASATEAGLL